MEKYLVMDCGNEYDNYEASPVTMTNDWKKWYDENKPNYRFAVYEYNEQTNAFEIVKDSDDPLEEGMAFYYWKPDEDPECFPPHIIKKWPGRTRKMKIPNEVLNWEGKRWGDDWDIEFEKAELRMGGAFRWTAREWKSEDEFVEGNYYVYGEYEDNKFTVGC